MPEQMRVEIGDTVLLPKLHKVSCGALRVHGGHLSVPGKHIPGNTGDSLFLLELLQHGQRFRADVHRAGLAVFGRCLKDPRLRRVLEVSPDRHRSGAPVNI